MNPGKEIALFCVCLVKQLIIMNYELYTWYSLIIFQIEHQPPTINQECYIFSLTLQIQPGKYNKHIFLLGM